MSAGSMSVPEGRAVTVRVPATSANLGPGFDTLGLALGFYDQLEVETRAEAGATVEVIGEGAIDSAAPVPTDASNLVVQSIAHAFAHAGVAMPGLNLRAHNNIPHSRGMGSSSAAIVSGLMAAKGLLEGIFEFNEVTLLELATELEGHPDNVAPALFGGLTIAWTTDEGPRCKKLLVHRGVSPLVLVPSFTMSTKLARSLQPDSVPHEDAIFNVSRSSLLVAALTQSPELLFESTEDKLHQDYRAEAMPQTSALIKVLRENGFAAVVSGAGPSILVLCSDPSQRIATAELVAQHEESPWRKLMLAVDFAGAVSWNTFSSSHAKK
ncbi:homoserine kinase [Aurantimicrobium minutum]|uniref:homoserine kinase n=1 Tax=Aurantimicrobium minutum TaxID=708131 RepID=UPI002474DEAB|nr:homoserine kinase [Aurantimicrobium minutum]MDH6533348.1 homoserine kinase [Aurantimicrobium minutum]